jgi:hypothetical protein
VVEVQLAVLYMGDLFYSLVDSHSLLHHVVDRVHLVSQDICTFTLRRRLRGSRRGEALKVALGVVRE